MDDGLHPQQRVRAPRPLQIYGRLVAGGSCGEIIRRYRDIDRVGWIYDVRWDADSVVLPVRGDEIEVTV